MKLLTSFCQSLEKRNLKHFTRDVIKSLWEKINFTQKGKLKKNIAIYSFINALYKRSSRELVTTAIVK